MEIGCGVLSYALLTSATIPVCPELFASVLIAAPILNAAGFCKYRPKYEYKYVVSSSAQV